MMAAPWIWLLPQSEKRLGGITASQWSPARTNNKTSPNPAEMVLSSTAAHAAAQHLNLHPVGAYHGCGLFHGPPD